MSTTFSRLLPSLFPCTRLALLQRWAAIPTSILSKTRVPTHFNHQDIVRMNAQRKISRSLLSAAEICATAATNCLRILQRLMTINAIYPALDGLMQAVVARMLSLSSRPLRILKPLLPETPPLLPLPLPQLAESLWRRRQSLRQPVS